MNTGVSEVSPAGHVLLVVTLVVIAGCASTLSTISNADPSTDFSQFRTFGFYDKLSTDKDNYQSMESSFLKGAMAQEMDRRGLSYSKRPDLLVNFYIHTEEKIRSRNVPTTSAYYAYRDPFYDPFIAYPAYETRIDQYTMGTLNIDIVDAKAKKLVWEGMVSGRLTNSDVQNLEKTIDDAVATIMKDFPVN